MEEAKVNPFPAGTIPREDYPRPQWKRDGWMNLNGEWEFAFDYSDSGEERGMARDGEFPLRILVPFCPESRLSGIGNTDFIPAVWYRRTLRLENQPEGRAILHFGAVDYECKVWINGELAGTHKGGYSSFEMDVTDHLRAGDNQLVLLARDDTRSGLQPRGKQCVQLRSHGCVYTRTTGIWQTVWLEFVPDKYLLRPRMIPHAVDGALEITLFARGTARGDQARVTAFYEGREMGTAQVSFSGDQAHAVIALREKHLWFPGEPALYDLTVELLDGKTGEAVDRVESYFGLRDVALTDRALTINGRPVFMRTVLDQGFNPEGIYTGPSDDFLRRDIELSMELGFNGARLHQRVFEERTLYWADKLGYLVWGEYADGFNLGSAEAIEHFLPEWMETIGRDFNHPALVGWCPLNETYHSMALDIHVHTLLYRVTKAMDPTRPVIDASGGMHYETDMFDVHDYEQDPEKLRAYLAPMKEDPAVFHCPIGRYVGSAPRRPIEYHGQPYWVSEYGGTFWNPNQPEGGWGYGDACRTEEEFAARYEGLTDALLSHPRVCGFCYTQLTDIEQEQNGLYFYDRSRKHPDWVYDRIRRANRAVAAIEREEAGE